MMIIRRLVVPAAAVAMIWLVGSSGARADAIDGNWCAEDGRTLTINGPRITTPAGSTITGDYSRHGFVYVIPANEQA